MEPRVTNARCPPLSPRLEGGGEAWGIPNLAEKMDDRQPFVLTNLLVVRKVDGMTKNTMIAARSVRMVEGKLQTVITSILSLEKVRARWSLV